MQNTSTNYVSVQSGGPGVAAHVGLHALGALADQLGLSAALSSRITRRGERLPMNEVEAISLNLDTGGTRREFGQ